MRTLLLLALVLVPQSALALCNQLLSPTDYRICVESERRENNQKWDDLSAGIQRRHEDAMREDRERELERRIEKLERER